MRELCRVLKLGGRVALREDSWLQQLLPRDIGLGKPGLEYRLHALQVELLAAWQREVPGFVPYPFGWTRMLRDAGFRNVGAHSFVHELLPPFSVAQQDCIMPMLRSYIDDAQARALLDPDDVRTLEQLTERASPHYLLGRDDLYFVAVATIYTGEA